MFWLKRIRDLAALVGILCVAGAIYFAWLVRPLPEIALDWEGLSARTIEAGHCDLAFEIFLDESFNGSVEALDAAEDLLTGGDCPLTDPEFSAERIGWQREYFEYEAESEGTPYATTPLSEWFGLLGSAFYDYNEATGADLQYPLTVWTTYAARYLRCEMVPYTQTGVWNRLKEASETLEDPELLHPAWINWENECARRSLSLSQQLGRVLLNEDDLTKRGTIGEFITHQLWRATTGAEETSVEAEYLNAVLPLQAGARLGANACEAELPNAAPNATGTAAATFAELFFEDDHVPSAERLVEVAQGTYGSDADEEAEAFWRFAVAQATDDEELLATFADEDRAAYAQLLEEARNTSYVSVGEYLPVTPGLESGPCYAWYVEPATWAADKAKGEGAEAQEGGTRETADTSGGEEADGVSEDETAPE